MVAIYVAYTQPINPAGGTPVLTRAQIWNGLQRKIRRAQDFVPVISGCKVLEDNDNVVVREAYFTIGGVPGQSGKSVREVCKSYEPTKVCKPAVRQLCFNMFAGVTRRDCADMCGE